MYGAVLAPWGVLHPETPGRSIFPTPGHRKYTTTGSFWVEHTPGATYGGTGPLGKVVIGDVVVLAGGARMGITRQRTWERNQGAWALEG